MNGDYILNKLKEKGSPLRPSQDKISLPIIDRMCKKMKHGVKFKPIDVCSDHWIIDGHHRYISSILSSYDIEAVTDYPKPHVLNEIDWADVEFVEDDWDTPAKVKMLNGLDAEHNGMEIEDIEDILNEKA